MKGGTSSSDQGQQTTGKTGRRSPHGKFQPTAEQVRYAQLLNEDEPKWVKEKIEEVVELTKKPLDEVAIALHDCDYNVDSAVISLLENKYDQGEWTTFSYRRKKNVSADRISPVSAREKSTAGDFRQDRRQSRDGAISEAVEYNNRKNKNQQERISDGNNVPRQNGPSADTRPFGGNRNRNRENRGERSDQEDYRGNRENRRGDREISRGDRDNRRDQGGFTDDRGEQTDRVERKSRNDYRDRDRNERNNRGYRDDRGDRWDRNGTDNHLERSERWSNGDRSGDRGDRNGERGERNGARGDRNGDRGDRRFGGRGGANRRGGMGRGGRGGRMSRGRFPNNNNRSGGRRTDIMNGPSNDSDFSRSSEDWGTSPEKDDKDWGLPEPSGTTEDWGAGDWASEKQDAIDPLNMPSWAATEVEGNSGAKESDTSEKNLTNHVNHFPECDDDAILSSKIATKSSPLLTNHEELVRFSTPSTGASQSFSNDTSKTFGLLNDLSSSQLMENDLASLANANISQITNHLSPAVQASRLPTSTDQVTSQSAVVPAVSGQPQPQRQQKSRTKRVPKGQIPKQAVEMPGNNAALDSLDVQFGSLEFGGELTGRNVTEDEKSAPVSTEGNVSVPSSAKPPVVSTVTPPPPKTVTMPTSSMVSENSVVNAYEPMSPRHFAPPNTPVSKSTMTQITPEPSPRKDKAELHEPCTPPVTKKVDVSTSPMKLTATMTASIAKSNTEGVVTRATSLHPQIEAISTSDDTLDERVHQQAPAIGHSSSPHADQNAMRSRLSGNSAVGVSSSSTTRPNASTPSGVSLSGSGSSGPPPGIISGIQPSSAGVAKTTSSGVNRQPSHGTKPPNLPPGVMPLYGLPPAPGFAGFSPLAYPLDDIQMIQRMQMPPYYDISFPVATGRDGVQNAYSAADMKYNRNDASSPVPSTLTAGPHGQQAPFLNTHAQLHPFGYAGNLAFYHGGGMIGGFAAPYTTQMYQLPTKGPGVTTQFQHTFANQLGPHYTSGYDGMSNAHDFGKQGYQHPSQSKASTVAGSSSNSNASELSTGYKTQFTDKGYLSGTPPPLNISLSAPAHQPHPAGFPLLPVLAPTQHPPSLFPSHALSHQPLDTLNPSRGSQNQGKVTQSKSHHNPSIYQTPFWSGTN